jgi:hypothetical protein
MMCLGKRWPISMKSPAESLPHDMHFIDAATTAQPAESESEPAPNIAAPSEAVSLLAAEKQMLEKMANRAGLSEVLNDLCASIDAHGSPVASMVCLLDDEWLSPCAGPHVPPHLRLPSHLEVDSDIGRVGRDRSAPPPFRRV